MVEILSRPSNNLGPLREVFSRKHRVHCLKAVPGYWCKIAKHCKQILSPVIANCSIHAHCSTWKESNVTGTFHSISSRSFTRADENRSSSIEIGLGYRRPGSVLFRRGSYKPIIRDKIDKCSQHNPKIGPLTDLHTR